MKRAASVFRVLRSLGRKNKSHSRAGVSFLRAFQLLVMGVMVVFLGGFVRQQYVFTTETLPKGAAFLDLNLSELTRSEVSVALDEYFDAGGFDTISLVIHHDGVFQEELVMGLETLDVDLDVNRLTNALFTSPGSTDQVASVLFPDQVVLAFFEALSAYETEPQSADIVLEDGEWLLQEAQSGMTYTREQQMLLYQQLLALFDQPTSQPYVQVSLDPVAAARGADDLNEFFDDLQEVLAHQVRWDLDSEEMVLRLSEQPQLIDVDSVHQTWRVNEQELEAYVAAVASAFDRDPGYVLVDAPVEQEKGYLLSAYSGAFQDGRSLDQEDFFVQIHQALLERVDTIEARVETMSRMVEMEGFGELSLLSQGQSSYQQGNGADRVFNVKKGLKKYDGMVVPAGAEFSFNQVLGYVRYEDGWRPALAIFGGGGVRPVPGGGLCQVSTTVFRSAIHAGLPITERKPHSLDVSYYHAYGYGIDSTIYPPEDIDLKFVNDTPGPLFIRTYTDDEAEEAFVEVYGVDDGREVFLEKVENRPVNLEREVIYTDEIPTGLQEVTKGRTGRYIEWDWKVEYADGTVDHRSIETLYPARRRTVRVGTGPAEVAYE